MGCDILDLRCIFVNELVGSVTLTAILLAVAYFIIASKSRLGFDTTIILALPIILIVSLMVGGFAVIYAFATVLIAIMLAWLFDKITN